MKELTFDIGTMSEDEDAVAAYQQGIVDALFKLGLDDFVEYDETSPDLKTYKIAFSEDVKLPVQK